MPDLFSVFLYEIVSLSVSLACLSAYKQTPAYYLLCRCTFLCSLHPLQLPSPSLLCLIFPSISLFSYKRVTIFVDFWFGLCFNMVDQPGSLSQNPHSVGGFFFFYVTSCSLSSTLSCSLAGVAIYILVVSILECPSTSASFDISFPAL